jgi:hypothetical protein
LPDPEMPGSRLVSIHTEITSTQRREEREEIYQQKFGYSAQNVGSWHG